MSKRAPTLLVVEDAQDQAILVGVAARRAHPGLDVRIVNEGAAGVAYLAGEPPFADRKANPLPDLVILDLEMPDLHGIEVLAFVKDRLGPVSYPIVVLTGTTDEEAEGRVRALGAVDFRRKPTDLTTLGTVVREIVHEHIGRGEIIAAHIFESG